MTKLENDTWSIEISLDDTFGTDQGLEERYAVILNPHRYPRNEDNKAYSIIIRSREREYSVAMIGDNNCWDTNCAVLEGDCLTVVQGWDVTQFNVRSARVTRSAVIDSMAPCFEIHKIGEGYVFYGEMDITVLNDRLEQLWSFSGHDIFVSGSDKKPFEIKKDRICLYDFEDHYYELDFQGRLIAER